MRNPRDKVYADFLTNFAVAWVSSGLITPIITKFQNIDQAIFVPIFCMLGGLISLRLAVYYFEKYEF